MNCVIYYFTGTGNSLNLAAKLVSKLNAKLIPITDSEDPSKNETACVGLVYPTYMYRPPQLVARFISRMKKADYLFAVAVNGGDPGDVVEHTEKIVRGQGLSLHAGFKVHLPDNYTPFGGPPSKEKQAELFAAADRRVAEIAKVVETGREHRDPKPNWFKTTIHPALWYVVGYWAIPRSDSKFWLNENCVGCKSCSKVCPVANITMEDDRPKWHGHCEQCFACLQWCKKEAIELGKKTTGISRYHHPDIKRKQLFGRASKD